MADLEKSTRFYCEGLGFQVVSEQTYSSIEGDPGIAIDGGGQDMRFVVRTLSGHGLTLNFNHPQVISKPLRRAEDQYGFSNWAFSVDSLEESIEHLCKLGGREKPNSRHDVKVGETMTRTAICFDPDGENVELIEVSVKC